MWIPVFLIALNTFFYNENTESEKQRIIGYPLLGGVIAERAITQESGSENDMTNSKDDSKKLEALFADKEAFREKVLAYEKAFTENSYEGEIEKESSFAYQKGSIPILISAPHSTKHLREGNVKSADIYTGATTLLLGELTDAHVLYTTKLADDANYIKDGEYKNQLRQIVEENDIQYVLDLHGASSSQPFDIDLGTVNGQSMTSSSVERMRSIFNENGISEVLENGFFAASTSGTITNYSFNQLGTDAVQIEINQNYRNPRYDIDSYYQMVKSLITIVNGFEQ